MAGDSSAKTSSGTAAFTGSVPENYDRYMGPMFFVPYANDIAERLPPLAQNVLEIACGTGISTRAIRDAMPAEARLVATDLNDGMIEQARGKFAEGEHVEFRQADAADLPFEDASFDVVVCQFGVMFFPDKSAAFGEIHRVLAPGGTFLFNVWDRLERNEISQAVDDAVRELFPDDPPRFYETPFGFNDPPTIQALLEGAGFVDIGYTFVELPCVAASAEDAARGLIQGTPMVGQIMERHPDVEAVTAAVAEKIRSRFGDDPINTKMQAIVWTARKQ
ncbi:MAG: class I SAM-dependent methyltransferase [Pyrinomonadaceae bacterium]